MQNENINTPSKIIFLDIDGVVCLYPKWQTDWCGNQNTSFSNECCENLKAVLDATGAKIVVTSSWRLFPKRFVDMRVQFESSGLPNTNEYIIGRTKDFRTQPGIKGHIQMRWLEIQDYLSTAKVDNYIIIDDFDLGKYDKEHFVKTNMHRGLTGALADACISKLGRK